MKNTNPLITEVNQVNFTELGQLLADYLANPNTPLDWDKLANNPLHHLGIGSSTGELEQRLTILKQVYPAIKQYKDQLNISNSLVAETFELYIPLAQFMAAHSQAMRKQHHRASAFGINGAQGSGKTTINAFLQIILKQGLGLKTAGFSIDDVYKSHAQRQQMAATEHPLFAIRSVAGTHDTALAIDTLQALIHSKAGAKVAIPCFDKMAKGGQGDRVPEKDWPIVEGQVDIVIFEGWCVGAKPQNEEDLLVPINQREAREDSDGIWRKTMNQLLATEYQTLFALLDKLLVIQVKGMDEVLRNRERQEQHLREKLAQAEQAGKDIGELGAMTAQEVIDFISLYERTTRHMLDTLPNEASITVFIGEQHRIEKVRV